MRWSLCYEGAGVEGGAGRMKARWDQREGNRDSKEVQIRTRLTGHIFSCSWQDNQQLQIFFFVHAMRYHRLTSATHFFHSYYLRNFDPLIPGVGELDVLSPRCVKSHSHSCCQIRDMNSSQKTVAQKQGRKSIEAIPFKPRRGMLNMPACFHGKLIAIQQQHELSWSHFS